VSSPQGGPSQGHSPGGQGQQERSRTMQLTRQQKVRLIVGGLIAFSLFVLSILFLTGNLSPEVLLSHHQFIASGGPGGGYVLC